MVKAIVLTEKLPTVLKSLNDEQKANAAVALILIPTSNDVELLIVRRATRRADPWSGQMALPGGKREKNDENLRATVARETYEETGINLREGTFIGVLSAVQSVPRKDLVILPYVVMLEKEPQVCLNSELDAFMWVQYEKIVKTKGKTVESGFGEVSAFLVDNSVVWGITYGILQDFFSIVEAVKNK